MSTCCSRSFKCLFYFVTLFKTFCDGIELSTIEEPDLNIFRPSTLINFVYFHDSKTWNEARTVCQNLGGDLAKIDSEALVNIISNVAFENYQTDIFSKEYWIGLVEMTEGSHQWVLDCSPLNFGENFPASWKNDELCFRMRKDHTGERKKCDTEEGILCQITTDIPCSYITRIDSRLLSMSSYTPDCKSQCSDNVDCWAAVEMFPDKCIMLASADLGQGIFHLSSKFCLNVTLMDTNLVVPQNNSIIPGHNCSLTDYSSTISPTPSLSLVSTSSAEVLPTFSTLCPSSVQYSSSISICVTATSTVTSFITDFSSVPFDVTQTVNVTDTVYNTEFINVTQAQTTTITDFSNVTQTVYTTHLFTDTSTETFYLTSTELFTVTQSVSSIEKKNYTTEQAEIIAEEFVKNLTINSKMTAAYLRKLNSADDKRASVKYMGTIGIISVVIPLAIMLSSDLKNVFLHIKSHTSIYSRRQIKENTFD